MITSINTIVLFFFLNSGWYHPVHVSITNIEFQEDDSKITASVKLFEDDFRLLFFHLNQVEINLKDTSNYEKYKHLIVPYLKNNFVLFINKKSKPDLLITHWKINEDAIWFYLESSFKDKIENVEIRNTLLLDLYYDQKNLVIIKTKSKELGYQFDYKTTEHEIKFE